MDWRLDRKSVRIDECEVGKVSGIVRICGLGEVSDMYWVVRDIAP